MRFVLNTLSHMLWERFLDIQLLKVQVLVNQKLDGVQFLMVICLLKKEFQKKLISHEDLGYPSFV